MRKLARGKHPKHDVVESLRHVTARCVVNERELTEDFARLDDVDSDFFTRLGQHGQLHAPLSQNVYEASVVSGHVDELGARLAQAAGANSNVAHLVLIETRKNLHALSAWMAVTVPG